MTRRQFQYRLSRRSYQAEWGTSYTRSRFGNGSWGGSEAKPGVLAQFLIFFARILPKVGPLRTLTFKAPTSQTEARFLDSFRSTSQHYRVMLAEAASEAPPVQDTDLDTGKPTRAGEYGLADRTYAKLLDKLADQNFSGLTPELSADILNFFSDDSAPIATKKDPKEWQKVLTELDRLKASAAATAESVPATPATSAAP